MLRRISSDILVVFVVANAVFMVLIHLLMKPFDFGYKEDDVMCWIC